LPELQFTPFEEFAAVNEPGAEALARATAGGTLIPAQGKVLVYGDGGAGKTTLVNDLCFALSTGQSWLGLVEVDRPLRIAWIENEGPRQEFRKKLERKIEATGAKLDGRLTVLEEPWAEFTFREETHRRAIALAATEHEFDLLVVGPVATIGMVGGGTPDEIRAFDELLDEVLRLVDRPFAILAIHHENRAGQISGAWERVPDTLVHVTAQGNGRTRVYWQKCRWASALHETSSHLIWADGETYTVEAKPEVTDDTMRDDLLTAVRENGGTSWTKLRDNRDVRGNGTELATVRDRLIAEGALVNTAARDGHFKLWQPDDPACPRSHAGTAPERLTGTPPADEAEADPFPVPSIERNGRNGTDTTEPEANDDDDHLFDDDLSPTEDPA
jgi:hypothetical protein